MASPTRPRQQPGDAYPRFADGDVLIVLSPSRFYQLHARTLRMHSTFLATLLDDDNAAELSSRARKEGAKIKWRVEFSMPQRGEGGVGTFKLRKLDERGRAAGPGGYNFSSSSIHSGHLPEQIYHDYDNLFSAYYYQHISIRTDDGMDSVLRDVVGLTSVAEYLGSMRIVALPIDNALIKQGQMLWTAVSRAPWAWADLAVRVRSELVFREAIVHLVGQWPSLMDQASKQAIGLLSGNADTATSLLDKPPVSADAWRYNDLDAYGLTDPKDATNSTPITPPAYQVIHTLSPTIRALISAKHNELDATKLAIEMRIMGHYPAHLHRNGGPNGDHAFVPNVNALGARTTRGRGNPLRAGSYGADILAWMALNLFRHWLGQHMSGDRNRHSATDGGASFYRALHAGGAAYIDHGSLNSFCVYFPLSAKSRAVFEEQMGLLKESVRPFVVPLTKCELALDKAQAHALGYLTCVEVTREDLPWVGGRTEVPWESETQNAQGRVNAGARQMAEMRLGDRPNLGVDGGAAKRMTQLLVDDGRVNVHKMRADDGKRHKHHKGAPQDSENGHTGNPGSQKRARDTDAHHSSPEPDDESLTSAATPASMLKSAKRVRTRDDDQGSHHKSAKSHHKRVSSIDDQGNGTTPSTSHKRRHSTITANDKEKSKRKSQPTNSNQPPRDKDMTETEQARRARQIEAEIAQQFGSDSEADDALGRKAVTTKSRATDSGTTVKSKGSGKGKEVAVFADEEVEMGEQSQGPGRGRGGRARAHAGAAGKENAFDTAVDEQVGDAGLFVDEDDE